MSGYAKFRGKRRAELMFLSVLIIAAFGVDLAIEDADACTYDGAQPTCYSPTFLGETSEAPGKPELLEAKIERVSYNDGCGSDAGTCADINYDSVEFNVREKSYDDVDELGRMGLIVRAESNSDAGERFENSLSTVYEDSCARDGGLVINAYEGARTDAGSDGVLLRYTIDPPQYSGPGGIDVSIAFVDQNGNIGPFSDPVKLERRSVVYDL